MITLRMARLIEEHSESLSRGLLRQIQTSEETSDFKRVPALELQQRTYEIYRNLTDWLLHKTEKDIERTYTELARRRAGQGVAFSQFLCALARTKEQLWDFMQRERLIEEPVGLYGELELFRQIDHFFNRALYYAACTYEAEESRCAAAYALGRR